jgi:hypothetical protein
MLFYSNFSQKSEFAFVFGCGPGYFIKDNYLHHQISRNKFFGLSVLFNNKNRRIAVNPSLVYSYDKYITQLPYNSFCGITQRKFGLNLDMLLRLNKHSFFRAGLNFHKLDNSFIEVSYDQNSNTYNQISFSNSHIWYSNGEMYNGYSSNSYQVGIRAGLSFPFQFTKQEMKLNITLDHSASNIVNNDYYYKNPFGPSTKVLSKNSTPTKLLVALEIKLMKPKRKKKEEEE